MKTITRCGLVLLLLAGAYATLYYVRRVRGIRLPVADQIAWKSTEPIQNIRTWYRIDRFMRRLIIGQWATPEGGMITVSGDGHTSFRLGIFEAEGSGTFIREPSLAGRGGISGFAHPFHRDGVSYIMNVLPEWEKGGMIADDRMYVVIWRRDTKLPEEVYRGNLTKMANKTQQDKPR